VAGCTIVLGLAVTLAAVVVPIVQRAPRQDLLDLAVPGVLLVCAWVLFRRGTWLPSALLAVAATFWSLTGMAGVLAEFVEEPLTRVALVPHVCVVATVLALPYGEVQTSRRWLVAAAAATAALAGAGAGLPVLALLGVVLAISGLERLGSRGRAPEATATGAVELALATALIALELLGVDRLSLRSTADALDVVLVVAAIAATVILGREPMNPDDLTAELGRRVAAVLGVASVEVTFPVDDGAGAVDTHGRRLPVRADSTAIRAADGTVVARVSPMVSPSRATEQALAQRLLPLARHAMLNDHLRRQNDELAESRKRLAGAADQERLRVEESLSGSVLRRLDTIGGLVDDSPAQRVALVRVRREIADLVEGLDPLRGRTLSQALRADLADRVLLVDAAEVDAPPPVARAAWWIVAEAVTNALKHAPGALVVVTVGTDGEDLVVNVTDDGRGGADLQGPGLLGAADRAAIVDGRLSIRSDGSGTRLEARLPMATSQPLAASRSAPDPPAVQPSIASCP
jgi:hypothetical protein